MNVGSCHYFARNEFSTKKKICFQIIDKGKLFCQPGRFMLTIKDIRAGNTLARQRMFEEYPF